MAACSWLFMCGGRRAFWWHLIGSILLRGGGGAGDYTLLAGSGGVCYTVVVCFFNEAVCVVHCSSVGIIYFCSAQLLTA